MGKRKRNLEEVIDHLSPDIHLRFPFFNWFRCYNQQFGLIKQATAESRANKSQVKYLETLSEKESEIQTIYVSLHIQHGN